MKNMPTKTQQNYFQLMVFVLQEVLTEIFTRAKNKCNEDEVTLTLEKLKTTNISMSTYGKFVLIHKEAHYKEAQNICQNLKLQPLEIRTHDEAKAVGWIMRKHNITSVPAGIFYSHESKAYVYHSDFKPAKNNPFNSHNE